METMDGDLLQQIPLFASLSKDARDFISRRLKEEIFLSGEVIVRQGDTGDSLFIITRGLVQVTKREKDGTSHELARLQNGDYFGEMSLLAGQPRMADITAITETTTFILFKEDIDAILQEYPTIAVHFSKVLSKRLRNVSKLRSIAKQSDHVILLYSRYVEPQLQSVLMFNLAASFTRELMQRVLLIDIGSRVEHLSMLFHSALPPFERFIQQDILNGGDATPCIIPHRCGFHVLPLAIDVQNRPQGLEKSLSPLVEALRREYDYILINCPTDITVLSRTALEQSDLIVYLTPTSNNAIQRCKKDADMFAQGYGETNNLLIGILREEQQLNFSGRLLEENLTPHKFVSIHLNNSVTERFLRTGRPFVYEHPRSNISRSLQQLTRKIGRVRVGLALGSGAARGFAHAGVLKVLEEQDIPINMITGASMGAFVGGFYAAGVSASELEEMVLSYRNKRKVRRTIFDITLPLYGFSKGTHLAKFMRNRLGDITFDQLDIPFVAVATDISNGSEIVLRHGVVWKALRASGSVPVLFEPYELDGRYLIDGGITNPLPTDILIEQDVDIIISCTVNSIRNSFIHPKKAVASSNENHDDALVMPLENKKYGIIDAITRSMGIMSAANTLQKSRLADIDIRPKVSHVDWTDFHYGDILLDKGRRAAEEAIPGILALLQEKHHQP
ncbi:hypothetical protein CSA56_00790 [candidate division KSB3 bacterium]|uniref:Uncharacterized protein n=1 Tax=candidate division KSB3 bacterium TaxID=2044937 RepID=A0A2G6KKS3_9BACT|nr:MAG: hypothetical protein CSA56_00790 [candidate division KSB3 bacterium]